MSANRTHKEVHGYGIKNDYNSLFPDKVKMVSDILHMKEIIRDKIYSN